MILLCKFIATPLLIWISLLAARRWGAVIGMAIAGLPFISGPGSVFFSIEKGVGFAADAAFASLFGLMASCFYAVVYSHLARFCKWYVALPSALLSFFLMASLFKFIGPHSAVWYGVAFLFPLVCTKLIPQQPSSGPLPPSPSWKIPVQMVCGGAAVLIITGLPAFLGEFWSGALLSFPIISSIVIPFAHQGYGFNVVVDTVKGLLYGMTGTAAFNIFLSLTLGHFNTVACYIIAFVISMVFGIVIAMIDKKSSQNALKKSVSN